jgi:hypothetical protein
LPRLDREWRAVPDIARSDATADQFVMGRFDFGDDQARLGRAGRGGGEPLAEGD